MASFARSFKPPPAYLSPLRRPTMPGRTLSNSSELSIASSGDDVGEGVSPVSERITARQDAASPRSGNSRPIAIELPKIRKLNNTASVRTPPEPLSARGDLPGGYFPMHEDPKGRVHRPHPFHQETSFTRHSHPDSSSPMHIDRKEVGGARIAQASMPVASYIAPGFHDSPLPMGKYYPSNYEQHQRTASLQQSWRSAPRPSSTDALAARKQHGPTRAGDGEAAEARRKMQQYQRDMIAQAAMGLGGSAKTAAKSASGAGGGATTSLKDVWLTVPSSLRPASPRLHPLGSPGPVTPMDLEAAAAGYLEHGAGKSRDWSVTGAGIAPAQ
ncbi:hypothetical protein CDD80_3935 [Ophiocordyceps camponoti-rufipedis]|uniref:Uncharacterized protein n=1 Tax=Ophiocordyceps camponoti-rufipedis TaxID=2004952 RepID=A0A2C5Z1N0_9HYPO|nr:hypothetical protein CDD80_3935 [Ophiocordyceps camponoti-rufipedis]